MQAGKWIAIDRGSQDGPVTIEEIQAPVKCFPLAERISESGLVDLYRLYRTLPETRETEKGPLGESTQRADMEPMIC